MSLAYLGMESPFANLFLKWTYPFGRTIIELSSGYPLISGFYKLLAATIKLADSKNYFLPGCLTSSGGDNMQVSQDIEVDINGSSNVSINLFLETVVCFIMFLLF